MTTEQNILDTLTKEINGLGKLIKKHDLEIRKNGVLLEDLNQKSDLIIEALQMNTEASGRRIDDHETRITKLELR